MAQLNDLLVMGQSTLLGPLTAHSNATIKGLLTINTGSSNTGILAGSTYINAIDEQVIFQNNGAIRFGGASWDWNNWAGLKYVHSSKTISLGLADGTIFNANNAQSGGTLQFPGIATVKINGEVQAISANAFRAVCGNYGVFLRNDGANTYFLITASGDQYGSWNTLRPFYFNNESGNITMGHNVTISGNITASGTGTQDFSAGTLKFDTINIPTSSTSSTYGAGSSGQVLKSNGTTVYWGSDNNTWTANSASDAGYVAAGGTSNANKVWKCNSSGEPGWRTDSNTTYTFGAGTSQGQFQHKSSAESTYTSVTITDLSTTSTPTFAGIKIGSNGMLGAGSTIDSLICESNINTIVAADEYAVWLGSKGNASSTETSGVCFDGGTIKFWCPGDSDVRFLDSDCDNTETPTYVNIRANSYKAVSDARLKTNLVPLNTQSSILNLPLYKYDFINGAKNQIGCMAQDLQTICPELVTSDEKGYLSIQESKIVYLLIDEVKKLKNEIQQLKQGG